MCSESGSLWLPKATGRWLIAISGKFRIWSSCFFFFLSEIMADFGVWILFVLPVAMNPKSIMMGYSLGCKISCPLMSADQG